MAPSGTMHHGGHRPGPPPFGAPRAEPLRLLANPPAFASSRLHPNGFWFILYGGTPPSRVHGTRNVAGTAEFIAKGDWCAWQPTSGTVFNMESEQAQDFQAWNQDTELLGDNY